MANRYLRSDAMASTSPFMIAQTTPKTRHDYPTDSPPTHLRRFNDIEARHYMNVADAQTNNTDESQAAFRDLLFDNSFYLPSDAGHRWPTLVPKPAAPLEHSVLYNMPEYGPVTDETLTSYGLVPRPPVDEMAVMADMAARIRLRPSTVDRQLSPQSTTMPRARQTAAPPPPQHSRPVPTPQKLAAPQLTAGPSRPLQTRPQAPVVPFETIQHQDFIDRRIAKISDTAYTGTSRTSTQTKSNMVYHEKKTDFKYADHSDWETYPEPQISSKDADDELLAQRGQFNRRHGFNHVCACCSALTDSDKMRDLRKICDGTEQCSECKRRGSLCEYSIAKHDFLECNTPGVCTQIHENYRQFLSFKDKMRKDLGCRDKDLSRRWMWPEGVNRKTFYKNRERVHENELPPAGIANRYHKSKNPAGYTTDFPPLWMIEAFAPRVLENDEHIAELTSYWANRDELVHKTTPIPCKAQGKPAGDARGFRVRGHESWYKIDKVPAEWMMHYDSVEAIRTHDPDLWLDLCAQKRTAVKQAEEAERRRQRAADKRQAKGPDNTDRHAADRSDTNPFSPLSEGGVVVQSPPPTSTAQTHDDLEAYGHQLSQHEF